VGLNKRNINLKLTIEALESNRLKDLYGKSDAIIFEDLKSGEIKELFFQGNTEEQIKSIINLKPNTEEKNNEVY
jgi:hypothetical protein